MKHLLCFLTFAIEIKSEWSGLVGHFLSCHTWKIYKITKIHSQNFQNMDFKTILKDILKNSHTH